MHKYVLLLHVLAATIWTGGHIVLAVAILPRILRERSPSDLMRFESAYEKIGMPALVIQVITGLWLSHSLVPDVRSWIAADNFVTRLIVLKLSLLAATACVKDVPGASELPSSSLTSRRRCSCTSIW